ncbi:ATP-binding cassette domain-containing protein [bacterium]|nr:ATP-binding cassette domain-containing protein [bacterium]
MIEFENVFKAFGEKRVLNGLTLKIDKGERFFVLGKSGTGKSVLLKHLVGILKADQGTIRLDGEEIQNLKENEFNRIRKKCSIVFQLPALLDSLNLFENLCFGIKALSSDEKIKRVTSSLNAVDLSHLASDLFTKTPPELSYGEQKRMALARVLALDPDYILYDEPTTGLDPVTSRNIHKLILDVSQKLGKTSIVVSHDMPNALKTASRIALMDAGQVVFEGTPKEILECQHPLAISFMKGVKKHHD